jgi:hypothetical protein
MDQILLKKIELTRQRLYLVTELRNFDFLHPDVIMLSEDLDALILRFNNQKTDAAPDYNLNLTSRTQ